MVQRDEDPWMLAEDIPNMDFFSAQIWLRMYVDSIENAVGRNYQKILAVFKGTDLKFYYGRQDTLDFARHVLQKIDEDPAFGHEINRNIVTLSDAMTDYTRHHIYGKNLNRKTNEELWGCSSHSWPRTRRCMNGGV
ncbi:hypothetical protein KJ765_05295 [Candidatus Micrarchaeota archaeon]|nr:hypothetical protein [Candidatus Micrarchaeota archaeon]